MFGPEVLSAVTGTLSQTKIKRSNAKKSRVDSPFAGERLDSSNANL
jgi:hypothetical protein